MKQRDPICVCEHRQSRHFDFGSGRGCWLHGCGCLSFRPACSGVGPGVARAAANGARDGIMRAVEDGIRRMETSGRSAA